MKRINEVCLIILILLLSTNTVLAKEKVKFSKCVDGDTIKVEIGGEEKTVRFLAVDTPESVHPTKGVEYYGKEASEYTCSRVSKAKVIELEYDQGSDKEDKYDRLLAWVWVDSNLLQDELIKNGYAEVTYLYGDYKYTSLLQDHQKIAEASKIGIWNDKEREVFDSASGKEKATKSDNSKETIDINSMSTKEIISFIIIAVLISILTPTIKKVKRKIKKLMK